MEIIRFLLTRSRIILILTVVFGCLSGAMNAAMLALLNSALFSSIGAGGKLLAPFILLCAVAPLTRVISEVLLMRLGQDAIFALRTEMARQILAVPLRWFEQNGTHRILSMLTDDLSNLTGMVSLIPVLSINLAVVGSCLIYMGWLNWQLLLAILGFMALGILTYQFGVRRAEPHFQRSRQSENELQKHYQGVLQGMKELKLHQQRRQVFLTDVLDETAHVFRTETTRGMRIYFFAASWGQLLIFVIIGLSVFGLRGALGAETGLLSGFIMALLYMMAPLQMIMNSVPGLTRARIALQNIRDLGIDLSSSASPEASAGALPLTSRSVRLQLCNVAYSHRGADSLDEFTVGPVDLTIAPGELLFITGGNGSGKTTLAKLIVGLYTPDQGELWYDDERVTDENRDSYRQFFSAVFSDFFLFESLLGLEPAQLDDRAREYIRRLRLQEKVRVQDGVFSTTALSQGQRKRLALLTCCLEDRPVLFFDEWAADQDPSFKEFFYFTILPGLKAQGKTVIVISHDDRYYGVADRIVHLESGRLTGEAPAFLGHLAGNTAATS
ncbi:MAG TPA: cyclic peptide export ABC transporter [Candidatus Angelobacter sp.]|nr:cyclic peptide export ABC transporter [Candidatus Angelobacter sp.]